MVRRGLEVVRGAPAKENSCSTVDSSPRHGWTGGGKEKSQLCKKFM